MSKIILDAEDFFIEGAKGNPELLCAYFKEAVEQFKNSNYPVCHRVLRTYIVAAGKLDDVACFSNTTDKKLLKTLDSDTTLPKEHLNKIIEFLKLTQHEE